MLVNLIEPLKWRDEWPIRIRGGFLGLAVGDALGLPWETMGKEVVRAQFHGAMIGGGTWNRPRGTWSDDTSQALALADSLASYGPDPLKAAEALIVWYFEGKYTLDGKVFDIGLTTLKAIKALAGGVKPPKSGVKRATCGSLMRSFPVSVYTLCMSLDEAVRITHDFSAITHSHPLSMMSCGLYTVIIRALFAGYRLREAVKAASEALNWYYVGRPVWGEYARFFSYLWREKELLKEPREGSCFAPDALRGALWSLLTTNNFRDAVIAAIRLGGDTDTLGAITGSLAGAYYTVEAIPSKWITSLRGRDLIEGIVEKYIRVVKERCGK